ncbi:MTL alpha 2 [Spathaspora passalidarum NRRL Y-27907]|uniref:MTL alpha 2 n=1 Tax=Spathaspora passalidarum (strain NRRL Y-27907 / 11-Y1) TaxID=619300 RepID=G3ANQ5_SPAPN|nr:MTL alpha 2 [Spathaspora passalidarum NRRL Y-27907]EGW31990.1 MTL alpha 2 [Spathaspora passalidarum NRRL Y-27907]
MNKNIGTLTQINQRLLIHISTLSTFPVFDPENIKEEIDSYISKVKFIIETETLGEDEKDLIRRINGHAKVLECILSERIALQESSLGMLRVEEAVQEGADSCKRGSRRLVKQQLDILENWYNQNLQHPYLTRESIIELMNLTSLSKSQVQNWISNRRRKEKRTEIDPDLAPLLL